MILAKISQKNALIKLTLFLLISGLFIISPKLVQAGNSLYVDAQNGNDGGNTCQNPAAPCQTISNVITKIIAENGDAVYATGTFSNSSHINVASAQRGKAGSPTTFTSWRTIDPTKSDPKIDSLDYWQFTVQIGHNGEYTSYITVSYFELYNTIQSNVNITSSSDNIIIEHNIIHDGLNTGIAVGAGCDNVILRDNVIYNNTRQGINVIEAPNLVVSNNTIHDNQEGIVLNNVANSIIAQNSVFWQVSGAGIILNKGERVIISKNKVFESQGGILLRGTNNSTITNNIIYNNGKESILLSSEASDNKKRPIFLKYVLKI